MKFKWTVNWKFLPEDVFVGKPLALVLLAATLAAWAGFFLVKWPRALRTRHGCAPYFATLLTPLEPLFSSSGSAADVSSALRLSSGAGVRALSPDYIVFTLFVSNFVGVAFARTLHYQFYAWWVVCVLCVFREASCDSATTPTTTTINVG